MHTYAYEYTGNYCPTYWMWTETIVLKRHATALQCDSQQVQKAMERLLLPYWQTWGRETEHWIHWGTEPERGEWEEVTESGDRDYYIWEIKSVSFSYTLTLLSERTWKKALLSNSSFSKKHSSRLNPAILKIIYSMRCMRPLCRYLEMGNLPLDFRKNSGREEKAVAQTRMLMKYVMGERGGFTQESFLISKQACILT